MDKKISISMYRKMSGCATSEKKLREVYHVKYVKITARGFEFVFKK